ncbi:hypothetical protein ACS0TY_030695 [Phlomoides rotata]
MGLEFCFLQESKKKIVEDILCKSLWGGNNVGWAFKEDEQLEHGWSGGGKWTMGTERVECCMVNVYASCLPSERIELWDRLHSVVAQNQLVCICMAGDFNSTRRQSEIV